MPKSFENFLPILEQLKFKFLEGERRECDPIQDALQTYRAHDSQKAKLQTRNLKVKCYNCGNSADVKLADHSVLNVVGKGDVVF